MIRGPRPMGDEDPHQNQQRDLHSITTAYFELEFNDPRLGMMRSRVQVTSRGFLHQDRDGSAFPNRETFVRYDHRCFQQWVSRSRIRQPFRLPPSTIPLYNIEVTSVVSPNDFKFQMCKYQQSLRDLETKMEIFYNDTDNPPVYGSLASTDIVTGGCYALYSSLKRRWVRCKTFDCIENVTISSGIHVLLVDYAETEFVDTRRLQALPDVFTDLRAQGYSATLILLHEWNRVYTRDECNAFRRRILNKVFMAQVAMCDSSHLTCPKSPFVACLLRDLPNRGSRGLVGYGGSYGTTGTHQNFHVVHDL